MVNRDAEFMVDSGQMMSFHVNRGGWSWMNRNNEFMVSQSLGELTGLIRENQPDTGRRF